MRTNVRWLALVLALVVTGVWFFRGHNLGFTKNSVTHMVKDPVTELEGPVVENRWVPGVDFLAEGFAACAALLALSFFFKSAAGKSA